MEYKKGNRGNLAGNDKSIEKHYSYLQSIFPQLLNLHTLAV